MSITGGIVLFASIWFLVFLIVLQIRPESQAEAGEVVPGTPRGAPANIQIARKAKQTTVIAAVVWGIIAAAILTGGITLRDIDWFDRMGPEAGSTN